MSVWDMAQRGFGHTFIDGVCQDCGAVADRDHRRCERPGNKFYVSFDGPRKVDVDEFLERAPMFHVKHRTPAEQATIIAKARKGGMSTFHAAQARANAFIESDDPHVHDWDWEPGWLMMECSECDAKIPPGPTLAAALGEEHTVASSDSAYFKPGTKISFEPVVAKRSEIDQARLKEFYRPEPDYGERDWLRMLKAHYQPPTPPPEDPMLLDEYNDLLHKPAAELARIVRHKCDTIQTQGDLLDAQRDKLKELDAHWKYEKEVRAHLEGLLEKKDAKIEALTVEAQDPGLQAENSKLLERIASQRECIREIRRAKVDAVVINGLPQGSMQELTELRAFKRRAEYTLTDGPRTELTRLREEVRALRGMDRTLHGNEVGYDCQYGEEFERW